MTEVAPAFAEQVVDALQAIGGRHDGRRAVHAKGTLCAATFTGSQEAAGLTTAVHLQGEQLRAHVRYSNGGGKPDGPDFGRDGRGIAVKIYLPDGSTTDIVGVTLPVFLVRTPEDFLEFTIARRPDPETGDPDFAKVGAFMEKHPEALPAVQHSLAAQPPASYFGCTYNGLHAFKLIDADGDERFVRWSWESEDGEQTLDYELAKQRGVDYLQEQLAERLAGGPVTQILSARIAEPGDSLEDPTAAWPEDRERVELGRLEVTGIATDRETGDDVLVFDPTRVPEGIECSDDPILHFRSLAYSESVYRRSGVRRS